MIRIALVAAIWLALVAVVHAQPQPNPCGAREIIEAQLSEQYGETRMSGGLVGQGSDRILAVYASEETGTWTVLMLHADGRACILSAGQGWTDLSPVGPQGDDT